MIRTCLDEVIAAVRRVNAVFIGRRYQTIMQQMTCRWSNKLWHLHHLSIQLHSQLLKIEKGADQGRMAAMQLHSSRSDMCCSQLLLVGCRMHLSQASDGGESMF
jgi:hypothetical protein